MLHHRGQALHPASHIGVAHRDPHARARRDHRTALSAATASAGGVDAEMRSRRPSASSSTIAASGSLGGGASAGSAVSSI
jgi:hypothetical protein